MKQAVREFGSEYHWHTNEAFLTEAGNGLSDALTYRSGRDALKAVAQACVGRWKRVLLPALCCESMVAPFIGNGISVEFYRLNPDYTADLADVESKLTTDTVLLYQPYFGIPPFEKAVLERLRQDYPGVLFLEDRTHDLLIVRKGGFQADVTVASLRKWTAIPDGGLLWSNSLSVAPAPRDEVFAHIRTQALMLKSQFLASGDLSLKDHFRELLARASDMLDATSQPYAMSPESVSLLKKLDTEKMLRCRQENARCLHRLLKGVCIGGKLSFVTDAPERSTLYYPILVDDQAACQSLLAARGVFCPVIWPVPREALGICPLAEHTAAHMLGVPCDHRYTPADMEYIAGEIVRVCNEQ